MIYYYIRGFHQVSRSLISYAGKKVAGFTPSSWVLWSILFRLQSLCRVRNTWNHAQNDVRTPPDGRARAFSRWIIEKSMVIPILTVQHRPAPTSPQTQNMVQLNHNLELGALLPTFGSTHGTYLVVQYEGITPSGRGEWADPFFRHFGYILVAGAGFGSSY